MGICQSCLGARRGSGSSEEENSRLLYDNTQTNQYGSFGDQSTNAFQTDLQEFQRETEALQKIVALTSNHLVDIFAIPQHNVPLPLESSIPADQTRELHYQDLLAKLDFDEHSKDRLPNLGVSHFSNGWDLDDEQSEEIRRLGPPPAENIEPVLGGLADA